MRRWQVALCLAVLCVPYFYRLGRPDLWDANETLYAEPPREALETGHWLVPTMNYEPWFVKPPGVTWVTLPFYALLGPTEFAGRLPMALAAAVTILLTYLMVRRQAGTRAALLSVGVLATAAKFFMFSRQLAGDVYLTSALAVAAWGYFDWFRSEGRKRRGLWIAAFALAGGTLMKGPVAIALAGAFGVLHLLLLRRRDLLRASRPLLPGLFCLALAAPWFVYMGISYPEFAHVYFLEHHFDRVFTSLFGKRGPLFYPVAFLGDALPWSILFPVAIVVTLREGRKGRWRADPRTAPLLWCAVVFFLFSLSEGKRSVYLLPAYPAFAAVVGITLDRLATRAQWLRAERFFLIPLVVLAFFTGSVSVLLCKLYPPYTVMGLVAAAILFGWGVSLLAAWKRRSLLRAALFTTGFMVLLATWVAANLERVQSYRPARKFAVEVAALAGPKDQSGRYLVGLQSLTFYGKRPFFSAHDPEELRALCRKAPHTWVVLPEEAKGVLTGDEGLRSEVVARDDYLQVNLPALLKKRPIKRWLLLMKVTPKRGGKSGNN